MWNLYSVCKIYKGVCFCKEDYIFETKRNFITCWNEDENPPNKDSEPNKHPFQYPDHVFQWKVFCENRCSLKCCKIYRKTSVSRVKETMAQMFSYKFCEISRNTFFTEHLWTTDCFWCQHVWIIAKEKSWRNSLEQWNTQP